MDKLKLLIADDDEMNRKIIYNFLKNDYEILEAVDGKQTLDIIKNEKIDAMLLDIIMPEIDGLEVLEILRKDSQYDYLGILVATSTKERTERRALNLGADDIVAKPYDPVVIKKRLENIMMMKENLKMKNLLTDNNVEGFVSENKNKTYLNIKTLLERIEHESNIINANKSNHMLIDEMVGNIKKDIDKVTSILNED